MLGRRASAVAEAPAASPGVVVGGEAPDVVHDLLDALSASPEVAALTLHERLVLLAAASEPWWTPSRRTAARTPSVLAQALGGEWPSRIHAGLSEHPAAPVAPHQVPHLEDAVAEVLAAPAPQRSAFVASVVQQLRADRDL